MDPQRAFVNWLDTGTVAMSGFAIALVVIVLLWLLLSQTFKSAHNFNEVDNNPISKGISLFDILIGIIAIVALLAAMGTGFITGDIH